ncbi:MAG: hypothetical protein NXI23_17305 [Bacteroidetes bacterium]|nr:hypothetical protein [Bacteroidota bacterium]
MEEPFAIISIGIINDVLEIIDLVSQKETSDNDFFQHEIKKARRLIKNLPNSPGKESFCLSINHKDMTFKYYKTIELDAESLTLRSLPWRIGSNRSEESEDFIIKALSTKISSKQFKSIQNFLVDAYRLLTQYDQNEIDVSFS